MMWAVILVVVTSIKLQLPFEFDGSFALDDNEKNIDGAKAFGIDAYHFDGNAQALYNYIKAL